MSEDDPLDRGHLIDHAQALFPGAKIEVVYAPGEIIHLDVSSTRYTFEIGSDDDAYIFSNGEATFTIPLLEIDWDF